MRRRRHSVDLLPLLDVFMVVLFVFATIEEGRVDAAERTAADLQATIDELERRERHGATAAAELEAVRQAQAEAKERAAFEVDRLQGEVEGLREAMEKIRSDAERAARTAPLDGQEALRRQDVLEKLVDHFSVFEIEIAGELVGDEVVNRCCFRTEPMEGAWRLCGQVPASAADLTDWLAEGGSGLVEVLRQTKGGNALTVVRQDESATSKLSRKLEEQLRERLPDHKIYDEGVALHAMACASIQPSNEPPKQPSSGP